MPIANFKIGLGARMQDTSTINRDAVFDLIPCLGAITARVHRQCTPDGAWNPRQPFSCSQMIACGEFRHMRGGNTCTCLNNCWFIRIQRNTGKGWSNQNNRAIKAAIAYQ